MRSKLSAMFVLLATMFFVFPVQAQQPDCKPLMKPEQPLITIPEFKRTDDGILRGTVMLSDEGRAIPTSATGGCYWQQYIRFFKGPGAEAEPKTEIPPGTPLPGPTLRVRAGDMVELSFLNQINISHFPNSLDQGAHDAKGCDIVTAQRKNAPKQSRQILPRNDQFPNCLHGSSTANLHFHGTHTTPSTTGDDVLLFIHPALRDTGKIEPTDEFVKQQFGEFFKWCEKNGSPERWEQIPEAWRNDQERLLKHYDDTTPYQGVAPTPGHPALPPEMQLWPRNHDKISKGEWPQYSIGAFPYCFRLPTLLLGGKKFEMYQAPGTHWYHAHKHGSTALNVGNGMTGALIIEGQYDQSLKDFYKETSQHKNWGLEQQVLVIQQLEGSLNLMSPGTGPKAPLTVNGRLNPVITMRPNQVQLWRIINGAARNFVTFDSFTNIGPAKIEWRQIAQDGVQFAFANYERVGKVNAQFELATANRADLLVKSPAQAGTYELHVDESIGGASERTTTLLTVHVVADPNKKIDPPMDFIEKATDFPPFPTFLADIYKVDKNTHTLTFNTSPFSGRNNVGGAMPLHEINDKLFEDGYVNYNMTLNTTEEWTVANQTVNIAHPFHIHINPFQIIEVFRPTSAEASDPNNKCYADPLKPATWKACHPIAPPWVWWDTFAIPIARQDTLPTSVCTEVTKCPADIQKYTTCNSGTCKVTIPGNFKLRSRFADFTGQFVLHCHILAHEDRGMMQLVAVVEKGKELKTTDYTHH